MQERPMTRPVPRRQLSSDRAGGFWAHTLVLEKVCGGGRGEYSACKRFVMQQCGSPGEITARLAYRLSNRHGAELGAEDWC